MNTIQKTLGGTVALALSIASANAAEWTRSLDLPVANAASTYLSGPLAATAEAFWIGDTQPINPLTGALLSPRQLPERITYSDAGPSAYSSYRGRLWRLDLPNQRYTSDAAGHSWLTAVQSGAGQIDTLTMIPPDGAQRRERNGFGPEFSGYQIRSITPANDAAGAHVLLATTGQRAVLRVDHKLAIQARFDVPTCTTTVLGDEHGGIYAICPNQVMRVASAPQQGWTQALIVDQLHDYKVTPDGGILIGSGSGADLEWRLFNRDASEEFRFAAHDVATFAHGLWSWNAADRRLQQRSYSGTLVASVTASQPADMAAHDSGALLVSGPASEYSLYSASGQLVQRIPGVIAPTGTVSAIAFTDDALYAVDSNDAHVAHLLGEDGTPRSTDFSIAPSGDFNLRDVVAGENALCVQRDSFPFQTAFPMEMSIRCASHAGTALASLHFSEYNELLAIGDLLYVRGQSDLRLYARSGALVRTLALNPSDALDIDPRRGIAIARNDASRAQLSYYAPNGDLRFVRDTAATTAVFVADDGSVFGVAPGSTLSRFDGNGTPLGSALLSDAPIVQLDANAAGVVVVSTHRPTDATRPPTRVVTLTPNLSVIRSTHSVAATASVQTALALAADGSAWVAVRNDAGIQRLQIDLASGNLRSKSIFPITPFPAALGSDYRHADIQPNGTLRFLDYDTQLARLVLRSAVATGATFSGPIKQSSLAGTWYAPSATGQGVIVELLNGATQLFAAWYSYAPDGGNQLAKQQWLTVQGDVGEQRGAISLPIYRNSGGRFDLAGRTDALPVGSAELVFTSCDRMEFWYRIGDDVGAMPLQRLTPRTQACNNGTMNEGPADSAPTIDLTGPWYDPTRSGQGLAVSASGARFNQFFAGWFTYDADAADDADAQHWFTLQGANPTSYGQPVSASIFRTTGGSRSGQPTRNTHRVGVAQLTVHDCANATLEYVFDDSAVAGPFADRMRAVPLRRLGNCTQ